MPNYLKSISNNSKHFTNGKYYFVLDYSYDNYYLVTDDDNKEHYISIAYAIDNFMECMEAVNV